MRLGIIPAKAVALVPQQDVDPKVAVAIQVSTEIYADIRQRLNSFETRIALLTLDSVARLRGLIRRVSGRNDRISRRC